MHLVITFKDVSHKQEIISDVTEWFLFDNLLTITAKAYNFATETGFRKLEFKMDEIRTMLMSQDVTSDRRQATQK